jgi:four helix bundle protein
VRRAPCAVRRAPCLCSCSCWCWCWCWCWQKLQLVDHGPWRNLHRFSRSGSELRGFRVGMPCARTGGMAGWKRVEEIAAFRLSVQLRDDILELSDGPRFRGAADLRDQIRDSAASAPRNLSEGFDRYFHGEFAFFAGVAKGSLGETINHLDDSRRRGAVSAEDHARLISLAIEARKATAGLLRYLLSSGAPGETRPPRRRLPRRAPQIP